MLYCFMCVYVCERIQMKPVVTQIKGTAAWWQSNWTRLNSLNDNHTNDYNYKYISGQTAFRT